jgi:hypothetical protein
MPTASFESFHMNRGRSVVVIVVSAGVLVLGAAGLLRLPPAPSQVIGIAMLIGLLVTYATVLIVGMRKWAGARVRYQLDEGGLSMFGMGGELRDRVRWNEVSEYVIDTIHPSSSMQALTITRRHGATLRIVEGQTPEQQRAFRAFCGSFLGAVAERRAAAPGSAPIREGVSFYDKPVAHVLGVLMLVLLVAAVAASFFLDVGGEERMRLVLPIAVLAPFIYRTVLNRKAVKHPVR